MHNTIQSPISPDDFIQSRKLLQAYWLRGKTIGWAPPPDHSQIWGQEFWIHAGNIKFQNGEITAKRSIRLDWSGPLHDSPELQQRYPYLGYLILLEQEELLTFTKEIIDQDIVFVLQGNDRKVTYASGLQIFGVLDDLFSYSGKDLGISFTDNTNPTIKLWAPTARSVQVNLYKSGRDQNPIGSFEMKRQDHGIWSLKGEPNWNKHFYLFEIDVFVPLEAKFSKYLTTDPYSINLTKDSVKSQILDIQNPETKPSGWDLIKKKGLEAPEDIVIYELHVRDFSASDETVRSEYRGKFMAFTEERSNGIRHLKALAKSGLTHIHFLPIFDFATVKDQPKERLEPQIPHGIPADSDIPQALLGAVKDKDAFNWGYDPIHYFSPEGSYATNSEDHTRVRELREMVAALHKAGLRVIMDVVFNHTYRPSDDATPPLDRVVPGYYYRVDGNGQILPGAAGKCGDVATERKMAGKLMVDAIEFWARNYKIDGFRFDLMGFHTKDNLREARKALDALTTEKDGADGRNIYLYGEGWKFGTLDSILPDEACTQHNIFGMGIGTFNDRIRDCARGGDHSSEAKSDQGFVTGLFYDHNGQSSNKIPWRHEDRYPLLLHFSDVIRIGMAGNLKHFQLRCASGAILDACDYRYNGTPAGYSDRPSETVNFISAHDNYELWDHIAAKAPFEKADRNPPTATIDQRVRMQKLGLALIALSQGVPFFHAGSDFLRSKSGDNNSYNSGDWFNKLDFSLKDNNWGAGLPPGENRRDWEFWAPRLRHKDLKPSSNDMIACSEYFKTLLRIRKSSRLFRLRSLSEVQTRMRFLETDFGMCQPAGFIAMALQDDIDGLETLDKDRKTILVIINAALWTTEFRHDYLKQRAFQFHAEWTDKIEPRTKDVRFSFNEGLIISPPQTVLVLEELRT